MPPSHVPDVDDDLPFIDEHRVLVAAPAPAVWHALTRQVFGTGALGTEALAHVLAAEPRRASGRHLGEGATRPWFAVTDAVPGRRLRLAGRHRFSRYAFILTLATQPDGTLLSARTDAAFPGLHGRLYRWLVIDSGAHRVLVGRLLRTVRRRAERQSVR